MINITNLTQRDNGRVILDNINLTVPQETVLGILCQEKAERTALMEALSGACDITDGEILICGHNMTSDRLKAQSFIGYMPEGIPFYKNMTAIEFLSFITEARNLDFKQAQINIKKALTATGLLTVKDAIISKLSPTGKARLGIAQAVVSDPSVFLFNNPTRDLSKKEAQKIFKLINTLSRSKSVIIASEDPQMFSFCNSIAAIENGKLNTDVKDLIGKGAM